MTLKYSITSLNKYTLGQDKMSSLEGFLL